MIESRPVWSIIKWLTAQREPANRAGIEPKRLAKWQRQPSHVEFFAKKTTEKSTPPLAAERELPRRQTGMLSFETTFPS
jgi:hypothetical protein